METLTRYLVTVYYYQGGDEVCVFNNEENAKEYAKERRMDDLYVSRATVTKYEE